MIFPGGVIGGGYGAKGVTFDGSSDYLLLSGGLSGVSDGRVGITSFWINSSYTSANQYIFQCGNFQRFRIILDLTTGNLRIVGQNTSGTIILTLGSSSGVCDGSWHHILAAWDTDTGANNLVYVDGADDTSLTTRSAANIDYANDDCGLGRRIATDNFYLHSDLAEFYFTTEWLDITSSTVREKFAKNGRPVYLGSDGSKPTGTAPLVYLKGPASNWGTNSGSGGDFTTHGTFTDAATKPSY